MTEDDALRRIEARLARLEATLQSSGPTAVHQGPIVDPLPWPYGGWGGWGGGRPGPIVDPAVYAQYRYHMPVVVDPVPWPWGPSVDPATYAGAAQQAASAMYRRPGPGPIIDPPPIDVSRFTIEQLEAALHSISAEKARLNSMETMLRQQLEKRREE